MSKFWSRTAREAEPYVPGEQPSDVNVIKLNTNENPFPPSPLALEAMEQSINADLKKYPSPTADRLKAVIAEREGVDVNKVFVGNGSDEVLAFAFQAFFDPNEAIKMPEITYSFYPVYANLYDIPFQQIPLQNDLSIDVEGLKRSVGGVIFPNPNAPTGLALSRVEVESIVAHNPNQVVIVDEAYVEFGAESAISLTKQYPNLLVTKTLSKSHALAGLRVGYAIGDVALIEGLERIKNSFNSYTINRVSLAGAEAALADEPYYDETLQAIVKTREWVTHDLEQLGFWVAESKANFLFVKPNGIGAETLYQQLKARGVYIRYFNKPGLEGYVRISIGTDDEMKRLIDIIQALIS
ncbi:histidinol-phosphate transaminase [Alkalibacillus salilacus]|uniref:Histidinol-phosphate aminotransferase n=1 Tax=Alkalibacillus salilacus TaxID=284582 RepID=A0ABT9VEB9_9BACI|nr:histidinol-phosphate transaminase [Alkalibacillus salilacus]MDQ0159244.1 histidinol-phosphate aminotransferase [Alkalibacillus salilacus]